MNIISCDFHQIRKALRLSLNEMAVLQSVLHLSSNPKYGNKCVQTKDKMAEWLDLHRDTVFNALSSLEKKGLIERKEDGIVCTQFIHDVNLAGEEFMFWIKNGETELISVKMKELGLVEPPTVGNSDGVPRVGKTDGIVGNSDGDGQKVVGNSDAILIDSKVDTKKKSARKKKMFVKPELPEIIIEFAKSGFTEVEAKKFFYYYESKGWIVGKTPMQSWKAAVAQWIARNNEWGGRAAAPTAPRVSHIKPEDNEW